MFIKEPKSFHAASKPIIYFNWLMGMGIEWQIDLNDVQKFFMKLYTIIFIPMNWILIYIGVNTLKDGASLPNAPSSKTLIMYQVLVGTNCFVVVISPILIRFQRKVFVNTIPLMRGFSRSATPEGVSGLREFISKMPILNDKFEIILGARNEYRKLYISQICQVIAISLAMLLVCITSMQWIILLNGSILENFAIEVTLLYPLVVSLMLDLNFCNMVRYLQKKFRVLNDCLLRLANKPSTSHPGKKVFVISEKILRETTGRGIKNMKADNSLNYNHYLLHQIRKLHLDLCDLSRKINHVFGIQNVISMSTSFVMVTGFLYTIYSSVMQEKLTTDRVKDVVSSFVWTIIYAFKIWMVNHSCWRVSSEASETGTVIYEFLKSKVDIEFRKEIQEFGLQMLQNPVQFNARGFFPLDYSLVQGVIGSITTYLVILIQMNYATSSS